MVTGIEVMDTLFQNLRVGIRSLRRTPGVALLAVLTLALGIGLATAVFTVADALLLRGLPVRDQNRLIVLWGAAPERAFDYPVGFSDGGDFIRGSRRLERAALFLYNGAVPVPVRDGDRISRLRRALVSGEFFDVLGARALLGRALRPADDVRGAEPVAVLSHAVWQRRFNKDPGVLGRRVVLYGDGTPYTIVGVMPQGLDYPKGTDLWAPVVPSMSPETLSLMAFYVVGRLAPGATPADAADELTAFFRRAEDPGTREQHGVASPWPRLVLGDVRPALLAFAAATALILLITCINVANLLLLRGLARVREVAVRSALGASRGRIVSQLLAESALLAAAGGVFGVGVAAGALRAFIAFAPPGFPRLDEIHLSTTALTGAIAITAVATVVFALTPAILTSRVDLQQTLRSDARQSTGRRRRLATEVLVATQLAFALLVLSAAGIITRSLIKLERAELSLAPSRVLIAELALRDDLYADAKKQAALLERLVERLEALPGVLGASPVVAVPFSEGAGWDGKFAAEGQSPEAAAANPMLNMELATPGYFAALGIPVLRGRGFSDRDREGAPLVVVLSRSAARHYWPDDDPIGKRLVVEADQEHTLTVVGLVPDTRYRDLRDARPSIYFPLGQSTFPFAPTTLAIGTAGRPAELASTLRRVIGETDPGVALAEATPFEAFIEGPLAQPRVNAFLLVVFAGAALALAAVGLFGVVVTMVRHRTQELGIRLALGAAPRDLRHMVMRRGLAIAAAGLVPGLVGAQLANRLLAALLYQVSPTDGVTLVVTAGLLLGVAGLASAIPAQFSTRVDPVSALRAE
jgi:putative ABC transport system permease protein